MKFLILNTDYLEFLRWLYAQHPGLEKQSYEEQMRVRMESLFGVADFYSSNLRKLGYEAWDIHANNEFMQKKWAEEHGVRFSPDYEWRFRLRRGIIPWISRVRSWKWKYEILAAQIKYYKPDILLNQAMDGISGRFLKEMKPYVRLLVGQHAATRLSDTEDFSCYDLVVSSFPPTLEFFLHKGIPAELHRLGFEPKVLSYIKDEGKAFDVVFIGSFYKVHSSRTALLERLCSQFNQMRIWGPSVSHLSLTSSIRKCYMGQAWGRTMYQIFRSSKMVLNHHGDIPPYANNCRLYEATGVGTLLITDWKINLHEMFEPGKEVIAYRTPEECTELIKYYLEHEEEREVIARAGQQRTLREHTYYQRMRELVDIVRRYL